MSVTLIITKDNKAEMDSAAKHHFYNEVLKLWNQRAKAQGMKPHLKSTQEKKTEFLLGAVALADALAQSNESQITPKICFGIMLGEDLQPYEE